MTLFLDASVVLAACGRVTGASHALFEFAEAQGWKLVSSAYVLQEIERNLVAVGPKANEEWMQLRAKVRVVADELIHPWVVVFPVSKDRPVLFTAVAVADVLPTLDRADFGLVMNTGFYGLPVMKPGDFLHRERGAGRLIS